ncbi:11480_t:CDS:2, partial [Acaulospora colombiana]
GGTSKTAYADRGSDYGDGPSYGGSKNPYGENYAGNYKSHDNNREGGYGPPPKENDNFSNEQLTQKSTDTIYISNLSKEVTEEKLAEYFGSLGMLKMDKRTQKPKIAIQIILREEPSATDVLRLVVTHLEMKADSAVDILDHQEVGIGVVVAEHHLMVAAITTTTEAMEAAAATEIMIVAMIKTMEDRTNRMIDKNAGKILDIVLTS